MTYFIYAYFVNCFKCLVASLTLLRLNCRRISVHDFEKKNWRIADVIAHITYHIDQAVLMTLAISLYGLLQ